MDNNSVPNNALPNRLTTQNDNNLATQYNWTEVDYNQIELEDDSLDLEQPFYLSTFETDDIPGADLAVLSTQWGIISEYQLGDSGMFVRQAFDKAGFALLDQPEMIQESLFDNGAVDIDYVQNVFNDQMQSQPTPPAPTQEENPTVPIQTTPRNLSNPEQAGQAITTVTNNQLSVEEGQALAESLENYNLQISPASLAMATTVATSVDSPPEGGYGILGWERQRRELDMYTTIPDYYLNQEEAYEFVVADFLAGEGASTRAGIQNMANEVKKIQMPTNAEFYTLNAEITEDQKLLLANAIAIANPSYELFKGSTRQQIDRWESMNKKDSYELLTNDLVSGNFYQTESYTQLQKYFRDNDADFQPVAIPETNDKRVNEGLEQYKNYLSEFEEL